MDSETIRITISPIFFFCSISFTVGILVGVVLGLLEETMIVLQIIAATIFGNIIFFLMQPYLKRRTLRKRTR